MDYVSKWLADARFRIFGFNLFGIYFDRIHVLYFLAQKRSYDKKVLCDLFDYHFTAFGFLGYYGNGFFRMFSGPPDRLRRSRGYWIVVSAI